MTTNPGKGVAYFIGAGPGDPRLLTLRGAELLARADHVFVDSDVHREVVATHAPNATCVVVPRGKGLEHSDAIVALAKSGACVARLFAGDPLLFRWGDEEVQRVASAGIPIEIVAGVTSVTAASAYGGLVLARSSDASPSVAFAAIRDVAELHDWTKLSLATDTIAIVTSAAHVEELTSTLTYYGRSPSTPAALLRDVSMPTQKVLTGTLVEIRRMAVDLDDGEVMLLVGEPLALRETIRWFDVRPLFGKRVLVVRQEQGASKAAAIIRERGGEPITVAAIAIHPPSDPSQLQAAVRSLEKWTWVVFTSSNGVKAFFDELRAQKLDARAIRGKVAAIGPATANALEGQGIRADVIAKDPRAEGLSEELRAAMRPNERVLIPRAKTARELLPEALREAGHSVDVVTAYETHPIGPEAQAALREAVERADAVLLTSASSARSLVDAAGKEALARLVVASIGPVTTAAAAEMGLRVDVTAEVPSLEGTTLALEAFFAGR